MIVRYALECETCGKHHVLRIGMGQEASQSHRFNCRECAEDISIKMEVDYNEISVLISCVENARPSDNRDGDTIVNLDANFTFGPEEQFKDGVFPRLEQIKSAYSELNIDENVLESFAKSQSALLRPNYKEEWGDLQRAWNLHRNGKVRLSQKQINEGSGKYYPDDEMKTIEDWAWRFSTRLCSREYYEYFVDALELWNKIEDASRIVPFSDELQRTHSQRAEDYASVLRAFFTGYDEFGQVFLSIQNGFVIPASNAVSSRDFEKVRTFYGDCFERFASRCELIAMLNNLLNERGYDTFQSITMSEYRQSDKAARFKAFSTTPQFAVLNQEADNVLRNALHHGTYRFDVSSQTIVYRTGKGGQGDERRIAYTDYLIRICRIFLQMVTIFRIDMMVCHSLGRSFPV